MVETEKYRFLDCVSEVVNQGYLPQNKKKW
jgi:hypothetical protein